MRIRPERGLESQVAHVLPICSAVLRVKDINTLS
jgi:hypothetical protein